MTEKDNEKNKKKIHKMVGAGIGWVLGGPVGAVLGLLAGHAVENDPELLDKGLLGRGGLRGGRGGLKPHFDVLQVPYNAGSEEVKAAYKKLAQKYHPDRFVDSDPVIEELARGKMCEINEAYTAIMKSIDG